MPHWLSLMTESLPSLVWACLVFTVPLTLLSFVLGLSLGFVAALVRLLGERRAERFGPAFLDVLRDAG